MNKFSPFNLLAVDASTEVCSVALSIKGNLSSRICDTPKSHSKVLLPMVNELLQQAEMPLQSMDAIAVSLGPGSFTGIRIGLGVVQGLSYGANLPIIGLSTLEILAFQVAARSPGKLLVPALDARMGEVYWAAYIRKGERLEQAHDAMVCPPEEMKAVLENAFGAHDILAHGHGWALPELAKYLAEQADGAIKPRAQDAIALAEQKIYSDGLNQFSVGVVEPLYLRNEVSWQKRKRIRQ